MFVSNLSKKRSNFLQQELAPPFDIFVAHSLYFFRPQLERRSFKFTSGG